MCFSCGLRSAAIVAIAIATTPAAFAQTKVKPKVFDLTKPTQPAPESGPAPRPPVAGIVPGSRTARRRAKTLEQMADRLERAAGRAFRRGLMPAADFALQTGIARDLQVSAASLRGSAAARGRALRRHELRLADAAARLRGLRQPAAKGWEAETALLDLLAVQAKAAAATQRRTPAINGAWNRKVVEAARRYQQLVTRDHTAGLATNRQLADSAVRLARAVQSADARQAAAAWREVVKVLDKPARRLAKTRDGDKSPELAHLKAIQHLASSMAAAAAGSKSDAVAELNDAADQNHAELDRLNARLKTGTSSLFEVARAWNDARFVQQRRQQLGNAKPGLDGSLKAELQQLVENAGRVRDRRGRIEADLAFIDSLDALAKAPPIASGKPTKPKAKRKVQPKVFELEPSKP